MPKNTRSRTRKQDQSAQVHTIASTETNLSQEIFKFLDDDGCNNTVDRGCDSMLGKRDRKNDKHESKKMKTQDETPVSSRKKYARKKQLKEKQVAKSQNDQDCQVSSKSQQLKNELTLDSDCKINRKQTLEQIAKSFIGIFQKVAYVNDIENQIQQGKNLILKFPDTVGKKPLFKAFINLVEFIKLASTDELKTFELPKESGFASIKESETILRQIQEYFRQLEKKKRLENLQYVAHVKQVIEKATDCYYDIMGKENKNILTFFTQFKQSLDLKDEEERTEAFFQPLFDTIDFKSVLLNADLLNSLILETNECQKLIEDRHIYEMCSTQFSKFKSNSQLETDSLGQKNDDNITVKNRNNSTSNVNLDQSQGNYQLSNAEIQGSHQHNQQVNFQVEQSQTFMMKNVNPTQSQYSQTNNNTMNQISTINSLTSPGLQNFVSPHDQFLQTLTLGITKSLESFNKVMEKHETISDNLKSQSTKLDEHTNYHKQTIEYQTESTELFKQQQSNTKTILDTQQADSAKIKQTEAAVQTILEKLQQQELDNIEKMKRKEERRFKKSMKKSKQKEVNKNYSMGKTKSICKGKNADNKRKNAEKEQKNEESIEMVKQSDNLMEVNDKMILSNQGKQEDTSYQTKANDKNKIVQRKHKQVENYDDRRQPNDNNTKNKDDKEHGDDKNQENIQIKDDKNQKDGNHKNKSQIKDKKQPKDDKKSVKDVKMIKKEVQHENE
eukprot:403345782